MQCSKQAWVECLVVTALISIIFVSIPVCLGRVGLSWDGLNHQIYLGWSAASYRFERDFMAASTQSYQFPFLYWPVYKMALSGWSGLAAGIALALLHTLAVPPVWIVARAVIPEEGLQAALFRGVAVVLAFMSAVPLKILEATGNDLLAAIPLLWAIAILAEAGRQALSDHQDISTRVVMIAGLLVGAAVACKFSNAPLAVAVPVLIVSARQGLRRTCFQVLAFGFSALTGLLLLYGSWGWHLWEKFGNPIYPLYDGIFLVVRQWVGWSP